MPKKDDNSWKLIFDGDSLRPKDRDLARRKYAQRFASDPTQLDRIFSGEPIVIRSDLGHSSATKIQADLNEIGMRCRVVSVDDPPAQIPGAPSGGASVYSEQEIDAAFSGDFVRPRTGLIYRLSLLLVAGLMLLLPAFYLALIGAVAYAVYWHATGNLPLLMDPAAQTAALLGHGLVVATGVVLLLFLLKPFCARHRGIYAPIVLDPLRQPTLFYLVEQITQRIGAPMPSEIRVDARVNASASLRRGVFSRQLTLTIGMPLFLGMDVQTLSGILAHEFGHFAQRTGMRLRLVIERTNQWLYRRAYEPDSWDQFAQRLSDKRNLFLRLTGLASRAGIWLTRRILIVLAKSAGIFCRHMSRQMEYDADRFEVAMTGSSQFRHTAVQLRVLGAGFRMAVGQAQLIWRDNQLPNDLPSLAQRHAAAIDPAAAARIEAGIAARSTDVMDFHPPDRQRIRAAEGLQQAGIFAHTGPARHLLHRCDELCRKVTFAWFRDQGYSFDSKHLVSLDIVDCQLTQQDEQFEALHRYVGGSFIDHRVLPIPGIHKLLRKPASRLRDVLLAWREPLDGAAVAALSGRYADLLERLVNLNAAEALSRLHLEFDYGRYGADAADTASIQSQIRDVADDFEDVQDRLGVLEDALARRFAVSLSLGCRSGLLTVENIDRGLDALRALAQVCEHVVDIVGLERRLRSLLAMEQANPDNPQIANAITDSLADYQRWLDRVNNALIRVPNPLKPATCLGETVWQWTPDREYVGNDPEAACQTLRGIIDALRFLNGRITARLAEHAERVETTLGG